MNRFEKVVEILDSSIGGPAAQIGVHGPFWRGKTRDEFVALVVRNRQLLVVGNGAGSNLVKALKGRCWSGIGKVERGKRSPPATSSAE